MKGQLRQDLATASKRSQHDLDVYNNTKGALTQASNQNLAAGLGTAASYAAAAHNENRQDAYANKYGASVAMGTGTEPMSARMGSLGATGMEAYGGPPTTLPNMNMGRTPGLPALGSRRYAKLGYNPNGL